MSTGSQPNSRTGLSKELVFETAIDLADRDGLDAVSIRNLAQTLGVGAMTLYHYVDDKEEIIAGMVDVILSEIEVAAGGANWRQAIRQTATSAHAALSRHPWSANLMFRAGNGPGRLRYMESLLRPLRTGGFSPEVTHRAYHALDSHIVGFTLWQSSIQIDPEELDDLAASFMSGIPAEEYPYVIEHVKQHLDVSEEEGSTFEFGLDLILDSLARVKARGASRS